MGQDPERVVNQAEVRDLVTHCARLYPGKITVDAAVVATWTNALGDMTVDQADAALTEHQRTQPRNHVVSPADLWAAHRRLTGPAPSHRPEHVDRRMQFAPRNPIADEIAHAELARAWAHLGGKPNARRHRPPTTRTR